METAVITKNNKNKVAKPNGHLANGKSNGHSKLDWGVLPYSEMVELVEKLAGPRPELPADLEKLEWSPQAERVLKERYFLKNDNGEVIENTPEMCWRVAWELARAEVKYGKTRKEIIGFAKEYYKLMISRHFLPNSPTLMNAGKANGLQYSACYVLPVEDSLAGIFDGVKYQAIVHQSGGGTGFSFSRLRPQGSIVKTTMGVASGPVSFMRIYNEATQQIKQGGMRRGANMGILRVDHPDIMEFIHCKEDGGITNFNISVTITDKFMEALAKDEEYELISPNNKKVVGKLKASMVWDEIAKGAWATGDPGMIFIDRINDSPANPVRAEGWEVESTNPCGEQPLYPFDACNLGSIFLTYYVKNGDVDWEKLKETVHTSVRMLDSVIEMNPFPLAQIADTVKKIRRIGLGVGGWADMLVQMGIAYDSDQALELAEKVMKFINEEGHKASRDVASERGAFPLWKDSVYKDNPMRNSTVTTIAPTGSIGILANASGGIEPLFAIAYQHIVKSENRTLTFVNPMFEQVAREKGFYSEELMAKVAEHGTVREIEEVPAEAKATFGTAHEIHPDWHVKMQAAFQKYTDNAVSKTINLPHDATVDDIKNAYMLAWTTDCRGITVFRDGCKGDQVLNLGTGAKTEKKEEAAAVAEAQAEPMKDRPQKVAGATYKINSPVGTAFVTINEAQTGEPLEVFINVGKAGSDVAAMAEALGRTISTSLRFRGYLTAKDRAFEIAHQLAGIGGRRSIGFGPNKILSLPDAVSYALSVHFGFAINGWNKSHTSSVPDPAVSAEGLPPKNGIMDQTAVSGTRDICPNCGEASLVNEEGCKKCYSCGHSEC